MAKKLKKLILNGEAYDLPTPATASSSAAWIVKLGSDTAQTTAANAVSSTASRTYAIQTNSSWQMVVNVPWEDSQTSWASSTTAGTLKLGSDTVQSTAANAVSSTASRSYALQLNASGQWVINVPWTDTTYSTVSKSDMDAGTGTTAWVVTAKDISDYVKWKLANTYVYKGSVSTYGDLPSTWLTAWDVYNVATAHTTDPKFPAGSNLAWDGEDWDVLWWVFDTSAFVDTSSAQTVGWTKTFTTSPVVPSKTSAVTNTWTSIATEAQVYAVKTAIPTVNNKTITFTQNWTSVGDITLNQSTDETIAFTDTTYESKAAASWGTAVSLVTTWEKYTWNNKADTSAIGNATITFKQWNSSTTIGTLTTNQSSAWTLQFHDSMPITQADYDNLSTAEKNNWNSYWIYETVS